jgi:hypothetical protein
MQSPKAATRKEADLAKFREEAVAAPKEAAVAAKRKPEVASDAEPSPPEELDASDTTDCGESCQKRVCLDPDRPFRDQRLEESRFSCFFEAGGRIFCDVCKRNHVKSALTSGKLKSNSWMICQLT